jgi:hypothetical protein
MKLEIKTMPELQNHPAQLLRLRRDFDLSNSSKVQSRGKRELPTIRIRYTANETSRGTRKVRVRLLHVHHRRSLFRLNPQIGASAMTKARLLEHPLVPSWRIKIKALRDREGRAAICTKWKKQGSNLCLSRARLSNSIEGNNSCRWPLASSAGYSLADILRGAEYIDPLEIALQVSTQVFTSTTIDLSRGGFAYGVRCRE